MDIDERLSAWGATCVQQVDIGSLIRRNEIAHKWTTPYFSMLVRESVCWRSHDLLAQARHLQLNGMYLGALTLVRSALETLAVLIYQNFKNQALLEGSIGFVEYHRTLQRLALGSKNQSTPEEAVNVMTLLKSCEKKYEHIGDIYASLCESAHPNFEGLICGYSEDNGKEYVTNFENRWGKLWGDLGDHILPLCINVFEHEYNEVWPVQFEKLESWILSNRDVLEQLRAQGAFARPRV